MRIVVNSKQFPQRPCLKRIQILFMRKNPPGIRVSPNTLISSHFVRFPNPLKSPLVNSLRIDPTYRNRNAFRDKIEVSRFNFPHFRLLLRMLQFPQRQNPFSPHLTNVGLKIKSIPIASRILNANSLDLPIDNALVNFCFPPSRIIKNPNATYFFRHFRSGEA